MNASQIRTDWSAEPEEAHGNAVAMVHRLLRGRYLLTITLAIVFATAGGLLGFLTQKPMFQSRVVIQIQPVLPKILFETEQSSAPQMFSSFVAAQAEIMQEQRVLEHAMDSDRWRPVSAWAGVTSVEAFRSNLRVQTTRSSQQLIFVSYQHEDARVAQAACQSVVDSYMELYGQSSELGSEVRIGLLETRRRALTDDKKRIDSDIAQLARQWGTDQLDMQMKAAFEAVSDYQEQKRQIESQIEDLRMLASGQGEGANPGGLTPEQAAELDPGVAELLAIRAELETQRRTFLTSGILEGHRDFRRNKAALEQVDAQIRDRIAAIEASVMSGESPEIPLSGMSLSALESRLARIDQRLREEQAIQEQLGQANLNLRDLNLQRADVESDIQSTEQRIDALKTEAQVGSFSDVSGRISVVGNATLPGTPSSDKRIKMAAAGFVGGGAVPVMLMMGLGMVGRRVRFSDDAILESAHSRIVGLLPDLGRSLTDRELAEASAFAVHQIRSQLQILFGREGSNVFAVTSPAPGDGKTSLIIALGLSYAESGDRTLLVDLDMIGRGLSLHFGYPAAPSLADAAAAKADLGGMVHETQFERLSVLPAGLGDELRISRLSPEVIRKLVESFRGVYDTVLIDSGPILGSIEAGLLAPSVDGMLMVVGRNQLRPLVKRAVDHINSVGGRVVATIFNRASIQELRQSSSSMSVHFSRQASRQAAEQSASGRPSIGPLGGTLVSKPAGEARGDGA